MTTCGTCHTSYGWCFICQRDNVPLRQYHQHDGQPAEACADEEACYQAYTQLRRDTRRHNALRNRPGAARNA